MFRIESIPILDRPVTAGRPADVSEDYRIDRWEWLPVPKTDNPEDKFIGIVVYGESMREAGITSGHIVVFQACEELEPGCLAVVATPMGLTVKFYEPDGAGYVWLHSANDLFEPQRWADTDINIRGSVVYNLQLWQLFNGEKVKRAEKQEKKDYWDLEYADPVPTA